MVEDSSQGMGYCCLQVRTAAPTSTYLPLSINFLSLTYRTTYRPITDLPTTVKNPITSTTPTVKCVVCYKPSTHKGGWWCWLTLLNDAPGSNRYVYLPIPTYLPLLSGSRPFRLFALSS